MLFPNGIGIDISDNHIRLAWLKHDGSVKALKEIKLPSGLVVDDQVEKKELLQSHIQEMLADPELKNLSGNLNLLVADSRVFVGTFWIDSNLKQVDIELEATRRGQTIIPLPFKNAIVDLELGGEIEEKTATAVFATPKDTVQRLEYAFEPFQIPIISIETDSGALHRLLHDHLDAEVRDKNLKMIIDFGRRWINISFFDAIGLCIFSRSIRVQSLEKDSQKESGELSAEHLAHVCDIIQETIQYFRGIDNQPISIFFAGNGGGAKQIHATCQSHLKKYSVQKVNEIVLLDGVDPALVQSFASAIGAARRSTKPRHFKNKHNFKGALL